MNQPASAKDQEILKKLSPGKIFLPVIIGVAVTIFLFARKYTLEDFAYLTHASFGALFLAVIVLIFRDASYIYRIRYLTDKKLSWTSSFFTILLWEFASAITPSAVGGTVIATFILSKEGLSFGKAIAFVFVTAIFDNLFFILAGAFVYLVYGNELFAGMPTVVPVGFAISYVLIALYTFIMAYGVFLKPRTFKWVLLKLTSFAWTSRWRKAAVEQSNEIIIASEEINNKGIGYWITGALSTIVVWVARYALLNFLIEAYTDASLADHVLIFAKHVVLWVVMLISITPGATGQAELAFAELFKGFLGEYSDMVAVLWRVFTYYPYLLAGFILLPRWIERVFKVKKPVVKTNPES